MKHILSSLRIMAYFTVLCGLTYPAAMTALSQVFFHENANGSLISRGGQIIGSELIAQNFEKPEYFWPRPSAVSFNPLPSGGSNLGSTSEALKIAVNERRAKLQKENPDAGVPPQHLLFASASGLDPHISAEAAEHQIQRVAKARGLAIEQVKQLVAAQFRPRQLGFLGEPTVNVLALNLSLDKMQGIEKAPVLAPEPAKTEASPSEDQNQPSSVGE